MVLAIDNDFHYKRNVTGMKIAYFDCFSGAGGDMIVASLVHAGAGADALREGLNALNLSGYALAIEPTVKQGIAAMRFHVELDRSEPQPHRNLADIVEILDHSGLPDRVRQQARRVFERLAAAEACVHGTTIEQVHFHEVGAVDAIIDVVAAVLALEMLDVGRVVCSAIPTGSGTVECDHGTLPIPAPATAELLKNVPLATCDVSGELTTPTAAAVLTTIASEFGPLPAMTVTSIGYGAGRREGASRPNVLRVFVGRTSADGDTDEVTVLETNVDDATPQLLGHCMERLLNEGALDVFAVPIHMKKSRTGVVLTVLCKPEQVEVLELILFAETTTFGVRRHNMLRAKMHHRHETVRTRFGEVGIKVGERDGVITATPEYEDCRIAAQAHAVALREVIAAAQLAWQAKATPAT